MLLTSVQSLQFLHRILSGAEHHTTGLWEMGSRKAKLTLPDFPNPQGWSLERLTVEKLEVEEQKRLGLGEEYPEAVQALGDAMMGRPGFGKVWVGFGAVLRTSFRKHSQGVFSLSGEASL